MTLTRFSGFPEAKVAAITLPDLIFTELVPQIDDLAELKVTLLVLRRLAQMRSNAAPWVTFAELQADPTIRAALGDPLDTQLMEALARAEQRGTLLVAEWRLADGTVERRYLANSPQGRAAWRAMQRGVEPARLEPATRPNIFILYEQNIGPLTALLSDDLREAEKTYPPEWIEEAFHEAVSRNKRNWKYIHAILERWRTEGKDEADRRDREADPRRYIEGKYKDFIQH
ncbi:MAG TPA: DnaD domain protein [Anaerolineae bacterium]|nr:DnaD domain protein [Anaerolineae bacterium]HQK14536.1 DnaD domain protein [Anaerolineae bacterium]